MIGLEETGSVTLVIMGLILVVAILLAQLRLFSIDRTLKAILLELRAEREIKAAASLYQSGPTPKQGTAAPLDDGLQS